MSIDEEKLEMWCKQVDKRLDRLEGENCKPKEPYIGDEETAEFVRAWAKHWGFKRVKANLVGKGVLTLSGWPIPTTEYGKGIDIQAEFVTGDVKNGFFYTIEELCGEEEE